MKTIFLLFALFISFQCFGIECTKIVARFFEEKHKLSEVPVKLIQGMKVELQVEGEPAVSAIYLGNLLTLSGKKDLVGFFEEGDPGVLHYVSTERLDFENAGEGHYIVKSVNQVGPRCAAYSLFNCVRQLKITPNLTNSAIEKSLVEEEDRSSLLVSILNSYYTGFRNNFDAITKIMKPFNYTTFKVPHDKDFKNAVEKYLKLGWPTLLTFDVSGEMSVVKYPIIAHDNGIEEASNFTKHLWMPKLSSQVRKAGHMVLVQGVFESNGVKKLLILDPNFQVPRLWDLSVLDNYIGGNIDAFVLYRPVVKK